MKRKYANYPGWKRMLDSRYYGAWLDTPEFQGYVGLLCMDAVTTPLVVDFFDQRICIVDAGYAWLRQFPRGEHYTLTAHFDAQARIVQWYIDIVLRTGVDPDGVPWVDDLYLDLVISPDLQVWVKDAGELQAARDTGEIGASEFELAWRVAYDLQERVAQGRFGLLALCDAHRRLLLPERL